MLLMHKEGKIIQKIKLNLNLFGNITRIRRCDMMNRIYFAVWIIGLVLFSSSASAQAIPIDGESSGVFVNPVGPPGMVITGAGTNSFTWGDPGSFGTGPSNLTFVGETFSTTTETEFLVGTLDYFNGTVVAGTQTDTVDMQVTISFTTPAGITENFIYDLTLINTPNVIGTPPEDQADIVFLPSLFPNTVFTIDGITHILKLTFGEVSPITGGFSEIDRFFVFEGQSASAELRGVITADIPPDIPGTITIIKTANPPDGVDFFFSGSEGLDDFILDDADPDDSDTVNNSVTFAELPAGDYTVTEAVPDGWELESVVCTGGDTDPIADGVIINLDPGEQITCIFTNNSVTAVSIDIKPGSDPNSINLKSKGVIPVAILTTDTFDATTVDPLSVEFGPNGAMEAHGQGHIEDVNGDDDLDLVLHFSTQETGIVCGDTSAFLTGETFNGQLIEGSDLINTVGCK